MCNQACINFGIKNIIENDIKGKKVIEIGCIDINGSLKTHIQKFEPIGYTGVDIISGKNVDVVCDAVKLFDSFEKESFDVLISTEVMEHIQDWRTAISNFKNIIKPEGFLLLTTRSIGFAYHGYPSDFWRYQEEDFKEIFKDFDIKTIEKDTMSPGVFIKANKPKIFVEVDLSKYELYNMSIKKKTL